MKSKVKKRSSELKDNSPSKRMKIDTSDWKKHATLLIRDYNSKPSDKLISFDLDGTLINTKSGARFAKNKDDWALWNEKVPSVLREYYNDGYRVVIFTNQGGIGLEKVKAEDFKEKVEKVQSELGVPMVVIAATESDMYRKPLKGMWEYFIDKFNKTTKIDLKKSYYVGDAAGRPEKAGKKKNFSDSDLKFALNVGLQFKTPEQFFLGEEETKGKVTTKDKESDTVKLSFDPRKLSTSGPVLKGHTEGKFIKDTQEVVIFVGSPASGKSTFWQNYMSDYVRVNRDTLKTKEKCVALLEKSLKEGKSCVVDNTNPEEVDRKLYIDVAKKHKVPVRCFVFNVTKEMAMHLDTQRKINGQRKHLSKHVGKIPIHTFFKKFQIPKKDEGFTAIEEVNFIAKFVNDKDKEAFNTLT